VRRDLPFRLRLRIPSTHSAVTSAVSEVCRLADRCGCPEDRQADLEIALREALANAISHGNGMRPGRKVFLRCYGGPRTGLIVAVRDEGNAFDPDTVPDPRAADRRHLDHGRGLLLMRELMDGLEFRRGGREVVLFQILGSQ
jgi:serine/threonine-protein kinase RsbW